MQTLEAEVVRLFQRKEGRAKYDQILETKD
jgi:hypothetical protein